MKSIQKSTAALILEDGQILYGTGFGAQASNIGEICFNTSMTGYQEILTDPSYAGQIITFTFPHIGNVGTNDEDIETLKPFSRGMIVREEITDPSNYRSTQHLDEWMKEHNLPGISGIDTRDLTKRIRDKGAPKGMIIHAPEITQIHINEAKEQIAAWSGLNGLDLAKEVTTPETYEWNETLWDQVNGYGAANDHQYHVVAVDFGAKRNILRCLSSSGCKVSVVNAKTSFDDIMALNPDGVFLSNGPGDPAATGEYAVPMIQKLLDNDVPVFGICLGHQLLALSLGGKTEKMTLGHRGANHPVKDLKTGKVEITSQNHGFMVLADSLPDTVEITHTSLFDQTNEGLRVKNKRAFSVQYHPEASPGPQDAHYLFDRFVEMMKDAA